MDVSHASLVVLILRLAVKIIGETRNSVFFPLRSQPLQHIVAPFVCCRRRCRVGLCSTETAKPLEILSVIVGVSLWQCVLAAEVSTQLQLFFFSFFVCLFKQFFSVCISTGRKNSVPTVSCGAEVSTEFRLNSHTSWFEQQQVLGPCFFSCVLLFFFFFLHSWHFVLTRLHNGHQSVSFPPLEGFSQCKTS